MWSRSASVVVRHAMHGVSPGRTRQSATPSRASPRAPTGLLPHSRLSTFEGESDVWNCKAWFACAPAVPVVGGADVPVRVAGDGRPRGHERPAGGRTGRLRPLHREVPRRQYRKHQRDAAAALAQYGRQHRRRQAWWPRAGPAEAAPAGRQRCGCRARRPQAGPGGSRIADASAGRRSQRRLRGSGPAHVRGADAQRHAPLRTMGLRHHGGGHQRAPGVGQVHRFGRGRGGHRHRHHQPCRPQRQHPAGLRLHQRHVRLARRQRPRCQPQRRRRLEPGGGRVLQRFAGDQFQLARHPCGRHGGGGDQQRQWRGRYRVRCQGGAGARAGSLRRLHLGHRRCDHLGLRRHGQRRARQRQPGRSDQLVAGWRRHLFQHLPDRDQRRRRSRHHGGGGGRQQQHQRVQFGSRQLPQRHRRGGDDLGRFACQLLQLRHGHRHLRTASCPRSTPAPPRRAAPAMPRTTAPRWRHRTWPAWSR